MLTVANRTPGTTVNRAEQTPRQLARMATMHRLPSIEGSMSHRAKGDMSKGVPSQHRLRQSFIVKSKSVGISGSFSGSKGSSFSFKRTDTTGYDQSSKVCVFWALLIAALTGMPDNPACPQTSSPTVGGVGLELTDLELTTAQSNPRPHIYSQSAANVLSSRLVVKV